MKSWTPEEIAYANKCMALAALTACLKPCPFCGGAAAIKSSMGYFNASCGRVDDGVLCPGNGSALQQRSAEDAAARWNKRAKP